MMTASWSTDCSKCWLAKGVIMLEKAKVASGAAQRLAHRPFAQ